MAQCMCPATSRCFTKSPHNILLSPRDVLPNQLTTFCYHPAMLCQINSQPFAIIPRCFVKSTHNLLLSPRDALSNQLTSLCYHPAMLCQTASQPFAIIPRYFTKSTHKPLLSPRNTCQIILLRFSPPLT